MESIIRSRLITLINDMGMSSGCLVIQNSLRCLSCEITFEFSVNHREFITNTERHFSCNKHFENAKWRLVKSSGHANNEYSINYEQPPTSFIDQYYNTSSQSQPAKKKKKLQQETKTPDCESAPFLSSEDLSFDAFIEVDTGASSSSSSRTVDSGSQTAEPAEEESELSLLSRIFEVKVTKRKLQNLDNHPFLKSCNVRLWP